MPILTGAFCLLIFWNSIVSSQTEDAIGRIVGGSNATHAQFPHQVSLRIRDMHFCGGSIISPTRILTAAHCVDSYPRDVEVVVGTINKSRSGQKYRVKRIRIHYRYDPRAILNDIATLETEKTISFNDYVQPIYLATRPPSSGTRVTASGWGFLQYKGLMPDKLQSVDLTVLDIKTCASIWKDNGVINDSNVCTTSPIGKGTCQGDSGGPLTDGYRLVGVVSWGAPCAQGFPDVFTSVSFHHKWIMEDY